jgi:hypothetical protein
MATLNVRTVTEISESAVESAMDALDITADLDFEAGMGAQYDFAELTDDEGRVVWSSDGPGSALARRFLDEVWS